MGIVDIIHKSEDQVDANIYKILIIVQFYRIYVTNTTTPIEMGMKIFT